jgi:SAM-dependent methyltransferase
MKQMTTTTGPVRESGAKLDRLMRVLDAIVDTPRTIAEIGCGVGTLALELASRYAQASVVGFDRSPESLARAGEHAARRGSSNIAFVCANYERMEELGALGEFDLVIAVEVFEQILGWPPAPHAYEIAGATMPDPCSRAILVAGSLARMLVPGGHFVSVERFEEPAQHWWWVRLLNDAGLTIAWDRSAELEAMPDLETPCRSMLVSALRERAAPPARLDDYLASALIPALEMPSQKQSFSGELAGVLFSVIGSKVLLGGFEAVYPSSGATIGQVPVSELVEVWRAGPLILQRRISNTGIRSLELRSGLASVDAIEELGFFAELLAGEYRALIRWHEIS